MIFNNTDECIAKLKSEYNIVGIVNCDDYTPTSVDLYEKIKKLHLVEYNSQDRIIFLITKDYYENSVGLMLQSIQCMLNTIDISNFFSCLVTTNNNVESEYESILKNVSTDPVPLHIYQCTGPYQQLGHSGHTAFTKYQKFNDLLDNVTDRHKKLLFDSDNFCMIPWTSMMIYTDSKVLPCSASTNIVGNCSTNSLSDIWNSSKMKQLRKDMLDDKIIDTCSDCTFKEKLGIDSSRKATNRQFAHHITKIDHTQDDGTLPKFELNFIDARFNNLCNLSCRICGPLNSTSWHQPAVMLGIIDQTTRPILIAGKQQYDIYDQLIEHVDTVEKIYFAGGEPFMIDQFYQIVEELDRQGRHDVELVYNTNLTQSSLKGKSIFDVWKNFKKISIGASLDAEGERGEYLRTGTKWKDVIAFRKEILNQRPDIDFYISATAYILNILHLPDFHQSWVEQGLIGAEDFNIKLLFNPDYLRADSAPEYLKQQVRQRYRRHLDWLRPRDNLGRAVFSFESVLNYIDSPGQFDSKLFWEQTNKLDAHHKHALLDVFPELKELPK
jgi:radical SAM protein with 4Fe4S-binding SPASM domain